MIKHPASPRVVALVGPQGAGKTTLLESLLQVTGAAPLKSQGGHGSPAERAMTLELTVASTDFLGERWTLLDCPGAPEFAQEARHGLMICDAALVVCDTGPDRAAALSPLFHFLDAHRIPHLLFLNALDESGASVRALIDSLQVVSARPLVLREIPLREGERMVGVVDLVSERAWGMAGDKEAALIPLPDSHRPLEEAARRQLLERMADQDEGLLEQLLEELVPPPSVLYAQLARALRDDRLVPVFIGSAERGLGLLRLLKGLRHEVPDVQETRTRLGLEGQAGPLAQVFKTYHPLHAGKHSLVRVWRGPVVDGSPLAGSRVGGVFRVHGARQSAVGSVGEGEVGILGRLEAAHTGDLLETAGTRRPTNWPVAPPPVHQVAITAEKRTDDVKLPGALSRLVEQDPSLSVDKDADTQQLLLGGQGELHLREALIHLGTRLRVPVVVHPMPVPFRESIRRQGSHHARYKRQSGGHGHFGDVVIEVRPLPRGQGFTFTSAVVGGAVPRQYIPAIEEGVLEGLRRGPLGFPVVDVAVTLTGGTYHSVDSSDQAFRTAARLAMAELLPKLEPVLLQPIVLVELHVPHEAMARAQRLVTSRHGQLLSFEANLELPSWALLTAYMPQAELKGFIVELRSASSGLGHYVARHDHYAELVGRMAERVVSHQPTAER